MDKRAVVYLIIAVIAALYIGDMTGSVIKTFCGCDRNLNPVCSANETTYLNKCVADCFNKKVKHNGACNICGDGICDSKENGFSCHIDCERDVCNDTFKTPYGYCKPEKPYYCSEGVFVNNCTYCGCATGQYCVTQNNACAHLLGARCIVDETEFLECSSTKPLFCNDDGILIERCDFCGCQNDMMCTKEGKCVPLRCNDGTLVRKCSSDKPKYCFLGELIDKCRICGCPEGKACTIYDTCI